MQALDNTQIPSEPNVLRTLLQRKRRLDMARVATAALTIDERYQFLSELVEQLEVFNPPHGIPKELLPEAPAWDATAATTATGVLGSAPVAQLNEAPSTAPRLRQGKPTRVDRAEGFIQAHPEGVALKVIAVTIDQKPMTATSTLRYLQRTRNTIFFKNGRWYPIGASPNGAAVTPPTGKPSTYREAIVAVLGGEPLEMGGIFAAVKRLIRGANYRSVAGEVKRMGKKHQLKIVGHGTNGRLYSLPGVSAKALDTSATSGKRQSGFFDSVKPPPANG